MRTYFFLLLLSTVLSYAMTRWLARWAAARGIFRDESSNGAAIPRLGGVAVFATAALALLCLWVWDNQVSQRFMQNPSLAVGLFFAAASVFLLGLYDDVRGTRPWMKLLVQLGAGTGLFLAGFRVETITNPFTHASLDIGWLALPVTLLWLVAISNAFNLIDGLDGLAAGVGVFATLALFLVCVLQAKSFEAATAITLAGALFGFLPHNFNPARIYLGDSGSLTIGLVLGALAVASAQKGPVLVTLAIPLIIFGLPLLDVSVTTLRRFLSGHPLFCRDEEHLHHRLVKIGLKPRDAVLVLYGVAAIFALASLLLVNYRGTLQPLIALLCGLLAWLVVRQMQYPEFSALGSHVGQEWRSQRHVLRNQILLRRIGAELKQSDSLDDLWSKTEEIFVSLGLDWATLDLPYAPLGTQHSYRWHAPGELPVEFGPPLETMWTLTIPLHWRGTLYGTLRIGRSLAQGPLLFRMTSVMEFFVETFCPRLAILLEQQPAQRIAAVAAGD